MCKERLLPTCVRAYACVHARTEGKPGEDAKREKERERLDLGRREANTAGIGIFSVVDRTVH